MSDNDVKTLLKDTLKKSGKPGLIIYAWQEDGKTVKISYSISKMKLKNAFPAVFWALSEMIKKKEK